MRLLDRRHSLMLIVAVMFSISLIGCGQNDSSKAQDNKTKDSDIALKVGSETLTKAEFNKRLEGQLQRIKRRLQQLPKSQREKQLERFRKRYKQRLAQQLETQLTLQHFMNQSNVSVSDEEVNNKFEQIKEQFPSEKAMKDTLQKQGESLESIKNQIRDRMKMQKFLEQELGEIEVSPREAEEYYEKNLDQFKQPEKVKARHILIKDDTGAEKEIQSIKDEIEKGEEFSKIAQERSEGPSSRQGGDLGYITRDRMVKPFSDAAFSLGIGEISDPVKTRYGWHLIKVEGKKESATPKYEDVEDTIVRRVKSDKRRKATQELIQELKGKVEIVNNVTSGTPKSARNQPPRPPQSP